MQLADSSPNPARNSGRRFCAFRRFRGNYPGPHLIHDEAVLRRVPRHFRVEGRHLDADRRQKRKVGVRGELIKRLGWGVRVRQRLAIVEGEGGRGTAGSLGMGKPYPGVS